MSRPFTKIKLFILLGTLSSIQMNAQFVNVATSAGITMVHDGESINEFMDVGSGVAWFDYNQDGWQDLYITMRAGANYLYENNGDGTFTNVAGTVGAEDSSGDGAGVVVADFNNDGWPDIYLANGNEDALLKNNGGTSFTDITISSGLNATGDRRGTSASWGDYDSDGYLDLYVSHHRPVGVGGYLDTEIQDFLFHNNGDETFTDVSTLLGISNLEGHGFIGGWSDIDNDNDLDLIVINDCLQNGAGAGTEGTKVYRNDGGTHGVNNWSFTEVAHSIGIIDPEDPTISDCRNGMGIAVGDFNRDGWMDFYYTNIGSVVLFENDGDGTFTNVSSSAGVETQPPSYFSWGASFVDYDLDGYQDIITAIGSLDLSPSISPQPNMLFKNNGDGTFSDVAPAMGLDDINKTRNMVFSDYDNDGDPDFLMLNYGIAPQLMRNDVDNGNHYLIVDLTGVESNLDGIGAKLKLTLPDATIQYFETRSGSNLGGGDALEAYFGLGTNTSITELEITWPAGGTQVLTNISVDQILYVSEDTSLPVEFASFSAKADEQTVVLDWATSSEKDNDYYSIQRSPNGLSFSEIGRVQGAGNSNEFLNYKFVDKQPLNGENYYRIRQTDANGTASFTEVEIVNFEAEKMEIELNPNPVTQGTFTINYVGNKEQVSFELFDLFGRRVNSGLLTAGYSNEINVSELSNGMYILNVSDDHYYQTKKIIINR